MRDPAHVADAATPQPPPQPGQTPVLPLVIADLEARGVMGEQKYGTPLMAENGRFALMDLYQELLDAVLYAKQGLLQAELLTPALPWRYAIGQKVCYEPYVHEGIRPECVPPDAYKVIGRDYLEMDGMRPQEKYVIQPWELSPHWAHSRPLVVFREQLSAYTEKD